jgi:hypothetical protein
MEQITLKFIGETALLTHNNRLANPLDKYTQVIGRKSGKRKKTLEDIWELARIEWEGGMYLYDGIIKLPMRVINKTMERGATKQKNGVLWKTGCIVMDDFCLLEYKGKSIQVEENGEIPNPELDPWFTEANYFQAMVKVGQATILRTRPIFHGWSCKTTITFDPSVINNESVLQAASDAGRLVGLCDWRPEKGGNFGRFRVEAVG